MARALAAVGSCRSQTGDVADRHDDYFADAVEGADGAEAQEEAET